MNAIIQEKQQNTTLKAIETHYDGYLFRSRLEARWAVFFNTLGIKYEYEKEGYQLDAGLYLPDFWLPESRVWVEVKGGEPLQNDKDRINELCLKSGYLGAIVGSPWHTRDTKQWLFPRSDNQFYTLYSDPDIKTSHNRSSCDVTTIDIDVDNILGKYFGRLAFPIFNDSNGPDVDTPDGYFYFDFFNMLEQLVMDVRHGQVDSLLDREVVQSTTIKQIKQASLSAKQARFEHGAKG